MDNDVVMVDGKGQRFPSELNKGRQNVPPREPYYPPLPLSIKLDLQPDRGDSDLVDWPWMLFETLMFAATKSTTYTD